MRLKYNHWQRLFIFCLGLFIGTAFCMKWMEADLQFNEEKFTILGLELSYSQQKVTHILSSLDYRLQTILRYHLFFDFAFMAGVYPGITSLCMMTREKVNSSLLKKLLYIFAALQLLAWFADIYENLWLLHWVREPSIGNEFALYHFAVIVKWVIALAGAFVAIALTIKKRKPTLVSKTLFFF
jgi:hypothetical protein